MSKFENASDALEFIGAGRAYFTVVSLKTGVRFTYRFKRSSKTKVKNDDGFRFVSVLNGPDNTSSYRYLGTYKDNLKLSTNDKQSQALIWVMNNLKNGVIPDTLEIWHEGRCGRCAKMLTVPSSIKSGFGPECSKFICK